MINKMRKTGQWIRKSREKCGLGIFRGFVILILILIVFIIVFTVDVSRQNYFRGTGGEIREDIYNITEESNGLEDVSFFREHIFSVAFIFVGILILLINFMVKFIKKKKLERNALSIK